MVEKWKLALKEFLKDYEEDDNVIGALLCGSYASGNFDSFSDIDVHLILKDDVKYRKRGNKESNSFLIEYFMNPAWKLKKEMKEEYEDGGFCTINMFAYGKVIYDMEGKVKELQDLALSYIDRPRSIINNNTLLINNYNIWNSLDELKACLKENNPQFNMIYYTLLYDVFNAYSKYLGIPLLPKNKIYKIVTDKNFRDNYHVFNLPEKEFLKLFINCFEIERVSAMYNNMQKLVNYYYEKQGGFNITTFELESKL